MTFRRCLTLDSIIRLRKQKLFGLVQTAEVKVKSLSGSPPRPGENLNGRTRSKVGALRCLVLHPSSINLILKLPRKSQTYSFRKNKFFKKSSGLLMSPIAGLRVTSRRPCWWSKTKAFLSSGNSNLFSCNFLE